MTSGHRCVLVVSARVVLAGDLAPLIEEGFAAHEEFKAVVGAVGVWLAVLDFGLVGVCDVEFNLEEVTLAHDASGPPGIGASFFIDEIANLGAQRAVLGSRHAAQTVLLFFVGVVSLRGDSGRPLVALV